MPSTSKKQHNFMAAVANNPAFAKKAGVPQSVGKEFNEADGGMTMVNKGGKMVPDFAADGKGKMAKGGMAHKDVKMDKSMMQKAVNKHEGRLHKGASMTKLAGGGMAASKMGAVKTGKTPDGIASKGKTKGTMIAMRNGGKC
jgi:hypothetical protein